MHDQYAAGLIDGEGCIRLMESRRGVVRVSVEVQMSVKALPILQQLRSTYGGNALSSKRDARTKTRAETWSWRMGGTEAVEFLRRIKPHLILKTEQAELAIWLHETVSQMPPGPGRGRPWSDEAKEIGRRARGRMSELNRKGPPRRAIPGRLPLATLEGGEWVTQQQTLDGLPEIFLGPFPKHGAMVDGQIFEVDIPATPTTANACSSWLPTPTASDAVTRDNPSQAKRKSPPISAVSQYFPTPRTTDANGPGKHGTGSMDLRTAIAELSGAPTPPLFNVGNE